MVYKDPDQTSNANTHVIDGSGTRFTCAACGTSVRALPKITPQEDFEWTSQEVCKRGDWYEIYQSGSAVAPVEVIEID
jgi:hypothetical protein